MRYSGSLHDAEQCLNDAFYKIFTRTSSYNQAGSFEGWMKRVLVNTCLDWIKSRKSVAGLKFVEVDEHTGLPQQVHMGNDALQQLGFNEIISAMQRLPETYRTVFNLHVFEGYTHKEIATLLSVKEGTSHWYLNQARELLKKELIKYQLKNG